MKFGGCKLSIPRMTSLSLYKVLVFPRPHDTAHIYFVLSPKAPLSCELDFPCFWHFTNLMNTSIFYVLIKKVFLMLITKLRYFGKMVLEGKFRVHQIKKIILCLIMLVYGYWGMAHLYLPGFSFRCKAFSFFHFVLLEPQCAAQSSGVVRNLGFLLRVNCLYKLFGTFLYKDIYIFSIYY